MMVLYLARRIVLWPLVLVCTAGIELCSLGMRLAAWGLDMEWDEDEDED